MKGLLAMESIAAASSHQGKYVLSGSAVPNALKPKIISSEKPGDGNYKKKNLRKY